MKKEREFYEIAYADNPTRRERGYGWEFTPSKILKHLISYGNLNKGKKKRALDLGCGDGRHIDFLLKHDFDVTGVDFSKNSVNLCKKRFKDKARIERIDLTSKNALEDLGYFDLIIDWSVLDHIRRRDIIIYLSNIKSVLKQTGYVIFIEFNKNNFPGLFKNKDYKVVNGHYSRAYTLNGLIDILQDFDVVKKLENYFEDEVNNIHMNGVIAKKRLEQSSKE